MSTLDEQQQARIEERRRIIASREPKEGTYNSRVTWNLGGHSGGGIVRGNGVKLSPRPIDHPEGIS